MLKPLQFGGGVIRDVGGQGDSKLPQQQEDAPHLGGWFSTLDIDRKLTAHSSDRCQVILADACTFAHSPNQKAQIFGSMERLFHKYLRW